MDDITWIRESLERIEKKLNEKCDQYDADITQLKVDVVTVKKDSGLAALLVSAIVTVVGLLVGFFIKGRQ